MARNPSKQGKCRGRTVDARLSCPPDGGAVRSSRDSSIASGAGRAVVSTISRSTVAWGLRGGSLAANVLPTALPAPRRAILALRRRALALFTTVAHRAPGAPVTHLLHQGVGAERGDRQPRQCAGRLEMGRPPELRRVAEGALGA